MFILIAKAIADHHAVAIARSQDFAVPLAR
jgi:hypothetical protein